MSDLDGIERRLAALGLVLIGEYQPNNMPGEFECAAGHRFTGRTSNVIHGQKQCPECKQQRILARAGRKLTEKEVNEQLNKYGFRLLSRYRNIHSPIQIVCELGHSMHTTLSRVRDGIQCPHCYPGALSVIRGIRLLNRERAGEDIELDAIHAAEKAIRDFTRHSGVAAYRELVALSCK